MKINEFVAYCVGYLEAKKKMEENNAAKKN
jgi:hypothetical protein